MSKLCDMEGVRTDENRPPELWNSEETGRLVIRAFNEGGYSYTDVDLWDLFAWLSSGPGAGVLLDHETKRGPTGDNPSGH